MKRSRTALLLLGPASGCSDSSANSDGMVAARDKGTDVGAVDLTPGHDALPQGDLAKKTDIWSQLDQGKQPDQSMDVMTPDLLQPDLLQPDLLQPDSSPPDVGGDIGGGSGGTFGSLCNSSKPCSSGYGCYHYPPSATSGFC